MHVNGFRLICISTEVISSCIFFALHTRCHVLIISFVLRVFANAESWHFAAQNTNIHFIYPRFVMG